MVGQIPPVGLHGCYGLPARHVDVDRCQHAQRDGQLLGRHATVVAVLAPRVPGALAPQAHHCIRPVQGHHPTTTQRDLVRGNGGGAWAPAIALSTAQLLGAVLQQVPVVRGHQHQPTGLTGLAQQGQQQTQVFQRPALMQLVRAAQVVVHRVVDHAHHPLGGV